MNAQREVIYNKRRNALWGDKLAMDLNNMLYDFVDEQVGEYKEEGDLEGLKLEFLRSLAWEPGIDAAMFKSMNQEALTEEIFAQANSYYKGKSADIANNSVPVLKIYIMKKATRYNI